MGLEVFIKLYNDLSHLDIERLSIVTYENNILTYRQINKIIQLPYMSLYYFPPNEKFRYGILTPIGLNSLLNTILKIIQDHKLVDNQLVFSPSKLSTIGYSLVENQNLPGPQELYKLNYMNITNPILKWITIMNSDSETKLLYRHIKTL